LAHGGCSGGGAHYQEQLTLNGKQIPDDATAFVVFAPDADKTKALLVPLTNGRFDSPQTRAGAVRA
jgi:hypothetical protein